MADFRFWTLMAVFGSWTLAVDFGFWILDTTDRYLDF